MNISTMTTQEIENFDWNSLSEVEKRKAIKLLSVEANIFRTQEQGNKLVLNSIYGAMANRFSYFYDKSLAEAITLQGQDAIRYSERVLNHYFHNIFHKDKKVLSALKEICPTINTEPKPCTQPFVVYMDTDSCYVSFEEVAKKINWTGSANDLILTIDKVSLADYLQKAFDAYAKKFNTDNYLSFELETIGDAGIWAQKKKYVQSITWEDGKVYDKNEYIKTTGLEIVRKNTPPFCRPELIKLVGWIFDKGKDFSQRDITIELLELKKRFSVADTEEICFNTGIGDYEKYILEDKDDIKVADGCGAHIRAAAIYNYYLHNNPEFKTKYERLKTGDSVRWYYAKTIKEELNVFAFKRGSFPKEFAPEIDIDLMFEKTIINPLNNIIKSMEGIDELQGSLKIKRKLF